MLNQERREIKQKENEGAGPKIDGHKKGSAKLLWKAFQFAFRVYTFAGGQDDRADMLTRELAQEIETDPGGLLFHSYSHLLIPVYQL